MRWPDCAGSQWRRRRPGWTWLTVRPADRGHAGQPRGPRRGGHAGRRRQPRWVVPQPSRRDRAQPARTLTRWASSTATSCTCATLARPTTARVRRRHRRRSHLGTRGHPRLASRPRAMVRIGRMRRVRGHCGCRAAPARPVRRCGHCWRCRCDTVHRRGRRVRTRLRRDHARGCRRRQRMASRPRRRRSGKAGRRPDEPAPRLRILASYGGPRRGRRGPRRRSLRRRRRGRHTHRRCHPVRRVRRPSGVGHRSRDAQLGRRNDHGAAPPRGPAVAAPTSGPTQPLRRPGVGRRTTGSRSLAVKYKVRS